jgi:hypothetical protein
LENLYSKELENLEEIGKVLDAFDQQKLSQKDINHLNKSITSNEIEAAIVSQKTKVWDTSGFTAEFYPTFKEQLILKFLKLFYEIEREGTLTNSFYEACSFGFFCFGFFLVRGSTMV